MTWESCDAHLRVLTSRRSSHHPPAPERLPARERCGARTMRRSFRAHPYPPSVSRMHTHHPCPGCKPTIPFPGLHPDRVCVDPLGQMEPGAPAERIHTHHPCPGRIPTVPFPGLHPGLVCVDPLGQMERSPARLRSTPLRPPRGPRFAGPFRGGSATSGPLTREQRFKGQGFPAPPLRRGPGEAKAEVLKALSGRVATAMRSA